MIIYEGYFNDNLNESYDIMNRISLQKISNGKTIQYLNSNDYHIIDDCRFADDFYSTIHYEILFDNQVVGIIGMNNYFDTFKNIHPVSKGKHTLWIQMIELNKNIVRNLRLSPLNMIKSIFEYLIEYCKDNDFKNMLCVPKNEQTKKLYLYGRFKEVNGFLNYII